MYKNLIVNKSPKSIQAEAYRSLRTNMNFLSVDKDLKTLVVTSSSAREGKSTVISNLAITLANTNKKVLIIDADNRKAKIHKFFEINNVAGLSNALFDKEHFSRFVKKTEIENLFILPSGPAAPNPSELLESNAMKDLIEVTKGEYDYVLIDTPPVGLVTDAAIISEISDGLILVVASEQTDKKNFKEAVESLKKVDANILGVVLNKLKGENLVGYKEYYNSGYYGYSMKKN